MAFETYATIERLMPENLFGQNLYHYTSSEGLLGIFGNKKMWFTQIFYLNDMEENLNAWHFFFSELAVFTSVFPEFERFREYVKKEFEDLQVDLENLSSESFNNISIQDFTMFVFSLSKDGDDLSQWRAYAGSGGFAIGFNFDEQFKTGQKTLKDFTDNPNEASSCKILLKPCIYDDKRKSQIILELLNQHLYNFIWGVHGWENQLFFDMLTLGLFFKNEKYSGEKECRLVVLPMEDHVNGESVIKFRPAKNFIIPFVELDVTKNCIKEIKVGPTPFKHHSMSSIDMLAKSHRRTFDTVTISSTKIPFRSW